MRLLVFTSLYPNAVQPHHGVFVRTRLERYLARHGGQARVVAPVPAAPPVGPARWRGYRQVPAQETVGALRVRHPRYLSPPGFGDAWRAGLMARGVAGVVAAEAQAFDPDLLDVHYAYPDGVAALRLRPRLERRLGRRLPLVLTCRGTDLNLLPQVPGVREQIAEVLAAADHVICVAEALSEVARELGAPPERVTTLRNGVDLERFSPGDRRAARAELGLDAEAHLVLCVGHLVARKGQHLLIPAFARGLGASDPRARLVLVGDGDDRAALQQLAARHGVGDRVDFVGAVHPDVLVRHYRAADVLVLASSREGWPNVVLEALACGLPVVATRVWGTPEILQGTSAGMLVEPTEEGLARGLAAWPELDAAAARPWAEAHGWDPTLQGMHEVFGAVACRQEEPA